MKSKSFSGPHLLAAYRGNNAMRDVLIALAPGTVLYCVLFSWGIAVNILLSVVIAVIVESFILYLRHRRVLEGLLDLSAVVTACLLALSLPPLLPWWVTVTAVVSAIGVAKHLYGGLGSNPFNPAMVGLIVVTVLFPIPMDNWLAPVSLTNASSHDISLILQAFLGETTVLDGYTMATPLEVLNIQLQNNKQFNDVFTQSIFGEFAGRGSEWINVAWLVGGGWLIVRKVITWHIPTAMLGTLALLSSLFYLINDTTHVTPWLQLFSGAALFGAFFIATDPVTSPASRGGQIIFAAGIGALVFIIRTWGAHPDGVAFAILLMNLCAPTIDYFYQQRIYGQRA